MTQNAASKVEIEDREREFHDNWADTIDPATVMVDESFTGFTSPEGRWLMQQLGSDLRGKKVLELGAGAGEGSVWFAKCGADVTATDLSPGMLKVVEKVAALHNVPVTTTVASAYDLSQFAEGSFDIVYAANLLHHVDIEKTFAEVKRVLKTGGVGAFWDPVHYNPVINVYRKMAMAVRTEDEHPLKRSDIQLAKSMFSNVKTQFFWLSALVVFLKFYLVDRIQPSEDRYWKLILTKEAELTWLRPFMAFDRFLITLIPPLKWWCWNVAMIVRK